MLTGPTLAEAWAMGRSKTIVELNAHRLRRLNDQLLKVGLVESERAAFIQSATLTKKGDLL